MLDILLSIDLFFFELFNKTLANPLFDAFFPSITDLHKETWFVAGVFPFILFLWFWKRRLQMLKIFFGMALSIGISDTLCGQFLKDGIARQRPVFNRIGHSVEVRTNTFSGHSLPSAHATNNFTWANYLSQYYPQHSSKYFVIAGLVAYSRVYVGVHYPFDIIAGGFLGFFIGWLIFQIYEYFCLNMMINIRLRRSRSNS